MSTTVFPSDEKSIFEKISKLELSALVRPSDPPAGLAGFLFSVDLDQVLKLQSSVTNRVVEDNTVINDNVSLLPETITLRGIVAELTFKSPANVKPAPPKPAPLPLFPGLFPSFKIGVAIPTIGPISPTTAPRIISSVAIELLGGTSIPNVVSKAVQGSINLAVSAATRTASSQINRTVGSIIGGSKADAAAVTVAIDAAASKALGALYTPALKDSVGRAVISSVKDAATAAATTPPSAPSMYSYYAGLANSDRKGTAQARAVGFFYQMWLGRQLWTIETPWGLFRDMVLLSGDFEQPEETLSATTMTVTFQKMRFANPASVSVGQLAGRAVFQSQAAAPADKGTAGQTPTTSAELSSWLYQLKNGGGGG